MNKKAKLAFGISEDGYSLRAVQIKKEKSILIIQALEHLKLEHPIYHVPASKLTQEIEAEPEYADPFKDNLWEDEINTNEDLIGDQTFEEELDFEGIDPVERFFDLLDLKNGVIALNVNEDNLLKTSTALKSSAAIKRFAKQNIPLNEYKHKEWQSNKIRFKDSPQVWIHHGHNILFDKLEAYRLKNKHKFFYQFADAHDLALTDCFRIHCLISDERTMLVHLGNEFRKIFIFENGEWVGTVPVNITQEKPGPEVLYLRVSLALESSGQKDPDRLVISGELASLELLQYMQEQNPDIPHETVSFSGIHVQQDAFEIDQVNHIFHFALPIAMAVKALSMQDKGWTLSNFLPGYVMERQKQFKLAWHGYLMLFLIFLAVMFSTRGSLISTRLLKQAETSKRELDFELNRLNAELTAVQAVQGELAMMDQNLAVLVQLLDGKNAYSELLGILNQTFASRPTSWLTSFKISQDKLSISGITTIRTNIVSIAEALPNSQILKTNLNPIRNVDTWSFEIVSDVPTVDWKANINQNQEELRIKKKAEAYRMSQAEAAKLVAEQSAAASSAGSTTSSSMFAVPQVTDAKTLLPPLMEVACPLPQKDLASYPQDEAKDFQNLMNAMNRPKSTAYRDMAVKFIQNHSSSELAAMARWWQAYRLYLDGEFHKADSSLEHLKTNNSIKAYIILLQARLAHARNNPSYKNLYYTLKNDYGRHPIAQQVELDLNAIQGGK